MATREPFRYELSPKAVDEQTRWLTVTMENVSDETVRALHVRLNSLDAYSIEVLSEDAFIPVLDPGAEDVVPMRVSATLSGSLYITVDGERNGESFHWESPDMTVRVGEEAAELVSLMALSEPETPVGEMVQCEATLRGRVQSEGLKLAFWVETPGGAFEELAAVETKPLSPDEEVRYVAQMEAEEEGPYTIYAYLYDGTTRLGRRKETIRVGEA